MDRCTENVIEWIENDKVATITLSQRGQISKIRKLAEEHPEDVQILHNNADGSICAHIPVSYIKFRAPRELTEETKQELADRATKARLSKLNNYNGI